MKVESEEDITLVVFHNSEFFSEERIWLTLSRRQHSSRQNVLDFPLKNFYFTLLCGHLLALAAVRRQQCPPFRPSPTIFCRSVKPALQFPQKLFQKSISKGFQYLIQGLGQAPPFNWNPTNQKVKKGMVTPNTSPARKQVQHFVLISGLSIPCYLLCSKSLFFTLVPGPRLQVTKPD